METEETLRWVLNTKGQGIWLSEQQNYIFRTNNKAMKRQNNYYYDNFVSGVI